MVSPTRAAQAARQPAEQKYRLVLMKFKRRFQSPLNKKARRGFRGYPVATVAFYGPDDTRAS